jgi:NarL family two-component system response regulator LiaR
VSISYVYGAAGGRTGVKLVVNASPTLFLESLTRALVGHGHTVQGASGDALAASALVPRFGADLCILDAVEGAPWLEAARRLRDRAPDVKIVVLRSGHSTAIRRAYDTRVVDAVVDRGCVYEQLDTTLLRTVRGDRCVAEYYRTSTQATEPAGPTTVLTPREREVLELLVRGATTYAIADALRISPYTVRTHVQGLMRKLGVHERGRAVSVALAQNLLEARTG